MCLRVQVRVTVPEIAVSMDAQEFQILQDVAAHLAAEQVCLPQCLAHASSFPTRHSHTHRDIKRREFPGTGF